MSTKGLSDRKTVNTVIVDDDLQSRKLLGILLKKFPQIKVVGEASNITSALDIIKETKPDSVFLDIKLGANSGFELVDKISCEAKVIFVSAYDDYALRAFEVNALDYIKKPIEKERLAKAITRLLATKNGNGSNGHDKLLKESSAQILKEKFDNELIKQNNSNEKSFTSNELGDDDEENFDELEITDDLEKDNSNNLDSKKKLEYDDRLFITSDGVSKFIKISNIQCITAEKDYSYIYLLGGKKLLVLKPMVEWEERLTPKHFVRIHRSTIVNLECVEKVEKWFNASYRVYIQNLHEPFQMSRRYASKLKERFK